MFDAVTASRFDGRIKVGKTWPCSFACFDATGAEFDVVAKYSAGCERGVKALCAEAIVAMLAADLRLPIPEPFAVSVDEEFIGLVAMRDAEVARRLRNSSPVVFGSRRVLHGSAVVPDLSDPKTRGEAAEIFAFDALIQNPDRRPENPNFLYNGDRFSIFDHELCLFTQGILFWQPPWTAGSLDVYKNTHAFYRKLVGRQYEFDRLTSEWRAISDERIKEYVLALPAEWIAEKSNQDAVDSMCQYIIDIRDNIGGGVNEVKRVLS